MAWYVHWWHTVCGDYAANAHFGFGCFCQRLWPRRFQHFWVSCISRVMWGAWFERCSCSLMEGSYGGLSDHHEFCSLKTSRSQRGVWSYYIETIVFEFFAIRFTYNQAQLQHKRLQRRSVIGESVSIDMTRTQDASCKLAFQVWRFLK